jgi:hypothetical protein
MIMTLEDVAHIGEVVGGIGVLGSLIFVGLQVQQNTKSVRASTLQLGTDFWTNLFVTLADPKFVEAYGKAIAGHDDLDQMQFMQFFLLIRAQLLGMETSTISTFRDFSTLRNILATRSPFASSFFLFREFGRCGKWCGTPLARISLFSLTKILPQHPCTETPYWGNGKP